ncbi:heavy-metal-associated domain-containing protein [Pseudomonas sp. Fig-3]|uniref:heavy-metal-associated domain-containing protein n=1 Tax=Gammaproteobacteria TaxID=1236 RepID=UPI001112A55C|nr:MULTISPECIES: heavy-metal-associated domain-containing protein [Gammaproteobacteria]KAB8007722.1 copper resistance protein CopZ [Klebsiella pneumoniae]KAB8016825.1 copper resistance protein CopZ [Klebsiella pneumoniae]KAB8029256.1 copper resistance protein CopZ [Klebsiella pneumoniae]MBB6667868.1 heavy-metal-associated domain-containing protein [Klebsiella pneumoniae]TNB81428.1 heavy-metal-associated domain-containing protein [Pseudomonas sp. Fig-3]
MLENMRYTVTGEEKMHCEGCESRVKNALQRLEGVQQVVANAEGQAIRVSIDSSKISPKQVEARLAQIGYEVSRA